MTRDDIIRMAREAGFETAQIDIVCRFAAVLDDFAALVAAAEREACAKLVEHYRSDWDMAETIRARGRNELS
jgi:hypothetical protein